MTLRRKSTKGYARTVLLILGETGVLGSAQRWTRRGFPTEHADVISLITAILPVLNEHRLSDLQTGGAEQAIWSRLADVSMFVVTRVRRYALLTKEDA